MIPLIVRVPAVEEQAAEAFDDEDISHRVCCRDDVSLCGLKLIGWVDCEEQPPADRCIRCDVIDEADVPCGAPFCRLRSAWRLLRGRR